MRIGVNDCAPNGMAERLKRAADAGGEAGSGIGMSSSLDMLVMNAEAAIAAALRDEVGAGVDCAMTSRGAG